MGGNASNSFTKTEFHMHSLLIFDIIPNSKHEGDGMEELYPMSVKLHWGFAVLTLGFALVHLWVLFKSPTFELLSKKIHAFIPMYYFFLVSILFTGLIAFTATHFQLTHWVAMMILLWVGMLGGSIRAYSLFKKTKFKHSEPAQEAFVAFAKKKYGFDSAVLLFLLVAA